MRTMKLVSLVGLFVLALLGSAAPPVNAIPIQEMGVCSGTSASVTITNIDYDCSQEVLDADGDWAVFCSANGSYCEYSIDNQVVQSENKSGTSGSWYFSDDYAANCASHTFQLCCYPKVDSTICWTHGACTTAPFPNLPRAGVTCEEATHPQYLCTGTASGGEPPYTGEWKEGTYNWVPAYPTSPSYGPWEGSFICKQPTPIRFRVTDSCGCVSNSATSFCGPFDP